MESQPVLVVDDDRHIRDALRALLETMGFRVTVAVNGADALERLHRGTLPCLVVLDLEMPVLDGWGLRDALLREPRLARIPVIVISARHHRRPAPPRVVADFAKPVDADELTDVIERHCETSEWQRAELHPGDGLHRRRQRLA
jgi:CheY-like chemotaxis protein